MARYEVTQGIDGLRLGLLASNPRLYTNQRLIEAGEERGHHIRFYNIEHCHIKLDTESPEILYRGGRLLNNLDAVIPRIKRNLTYHGSVLVRQFEGIGVYALNSARAINQTRDRLGAMQMLLQEGLDIPVSGFANTKIETGDLIDMVNGAPLIVKLLNDYQHQGSVLAETRKASESVIKAYKSLDANLLVQEFIREAGGKDLRLFVVDAKVVAAIQRKSAAGEFRADIHRGGSASVVKITSAERRIALKATRILGLKVAGVDIVRSERGPLLVDVTATPGFEAIEDATGKDIAGTLISAVEKKLGWKRPLAT